MENAIVEVHNNATNLIDASNVELGQQNGGVTTEKTALAVAACIEKSGQHDNIVDQVIDVVASQVTSGQQSTEVLKDGVLVSQVIASSIAGQICHEQRHQTILNSTELATAIVLKSAAGEILCGVYATRVDHGDTKKGHGKFIAVVNNAAMISSQIVLDVALNDNDMGGWIEVPSKKVSPGSTKLQQLDCTSPGRKEQAANYTPTLHISNPEIASIVKEPQAAMLIKENPMIKQPMWRINTSDHVVHSQSLESLGEKIGDFGLQLISTENDKDFVKDILHALVSHDMDTLNAIDNSKKSLTITTKDIGAFAKSHEPEAEVSGLSPTTTYDIGR
ncbi:hypothetical protein RND71_041031 [Anisodus tanguticus]|uniref:Uncharacterized protein n=1 Tax=Anisodus tanguticus TaxID=243964 RepID=A0AAE1QTD1_9SOLA|nr:hypothetical protein RND71_041031 [Anisodus tanguticus]